MRLWSICSVVVLACITLAPSISVAHNANIKTYYGHHHHHRRYRYYRFHHHHQPRRGQVYSTCTCNFGYGDVCSVVASCFAEGGRCIGEGPCVLKPQPEHVTSWKAPPPATTTELARKCRALTAKAYPSLVPGNPAAGAKGTAQVRGDYFNKCVSAGGQVDHHSGN
jgi:hypothetical protein